MAIQSGVNAALTSVANKRASFQSKTSKSVNPNRILNRKAMALAFTLLMTFAAFHDASAQSDNFDDGNDIGWIRHNPLTIVGAPAVISFPPDGMGGKAYRINAPAPPVSDAGPGRALVFQTNIYSNFYAAVDVIAFDNSLNQAFGLVFRAENIGLGTITGYIFNYNPQQASGGRGQIQINRVTNEAGAGTLGAANATLDPSHRYRFVLTVVDTEFTASVYDLADLTAPLASFTATDGDYTQGMVGVFNYYRGNAVTDKNAGRADSTFDNMFVAAVRPTSVLSPATPHSIVGMPQVVNRSPASRTNFYPAAEGIKFSATTLTTNSIKTNAIGLFLNGTDVSSGLAISGSASNANVSFNALSSNSVYDARIVLEDTSGRKSTNEWTFDTLSEDFLNSATVKVIEAEDYNYEGGKFQENPPVSGLTTSGTLVNGNGVGYYELIGVADVDYFDHSAQAGAAAQYRSADAPGTQAGALESGGAGQDIPPQNDTRRQKYAARNLNEYQIARTEGGEWLNYTRSFTPGDYNAYLRVGARAPQPVLLQRVTSDRTKPNQTTATLGTFQVPSTGLIVEYRYVPLTDASGKTATIKLGGLETLRLAIGGAQENVTQNTMTLNYVVFVPAAQPPAGALQLESASAVTGPYVADSSATFGTDLSVSTALSGTTRFYRLRAPAGSALTYRITAASIAAGRLVLRYENRAP
jgi:hypothetical protein